MQNVIAVNGGKVHKSHNQAAPLARCRQSSGQHGTQFRFTDAPITCTHCLTTDETAPAPRIFSATCDCGGAITGDGSRWRHRPGHGKGHRAHPVGTLRQI